MSFPKISDRKKFVETMPVSDIIEIMSEENEAALSIMNHIHRSTVGIMKDFLLTLDDMNIRGKQISFAFENIFNFDIKLFVANVLKRDHEIINGLNETKAREATGMHIVIQYGARHQHS